MKMCQFSYKAFGDSITVLKMKGKLQFFFILNDDLITLNPIKYKLLKRDGPFLIITPITINSHNLDYEHIQEKTKNMTKVKVP